MYFGSNFSTPLIFCNFCYDGQREGYSGLAYAQIMAIFSNNL